MNPIHMRMTLLVTFFALVVNVYAAINWEFVGPEGGIVDRLRVIDQNVFACCKGGLFISKDAGHTWTRTGDPAMFMSIASVRKIHNVLYAVGNSGVFTSSDNGETWKPRLDSGVYLTKVTDIVEHNGQLFASTDGSGVYRSQDSGRRWTSIQSNEIYPWAHVLLSMDSVLLVGTGRFSYRSVDNGTTWTTADSSAVFDLLRIGDTVYASGAGVVKSTDGGVTWTSNWLSDVRDIATDATGAIYAASIYRSKLHKSTDGGNMWVDIVNNAPTTTFNAVAVIGNSVLTSPYEFGVYRSENGGASWSKSSTGISTRQVYDVASARGVVFAAHENYGLHRSTDNGSTWMHQFGNERGVHVAAKNNKVMLGTWSPGVMYSSFDGGLAFTKEIQLLNQYSGIEGVYLDEHDMYYAAERGLARSSDNGLTWANAHTGMPEAYVVSMAFIDTVIFSGTNSSYKNKFAGTFRSMDKGKTWTELETGLSDDDDVNSMASLGSIIVIGTTRGIHRSTDLGATWIRTQVGDTKSMCTSGNTMYASNLYGVSFSTDTGSTWTAITPYIADQLTNEITVTNNYLIVGLDAGGVVRRKIDWVPVSVEWKVESGEHQRLTAYPNPVRYGSVDVELPPDFVSGVMTITDAIGKEVLTRSIVENKLNTVQLNTTGLPTGVYGVVLASEVGVWTTRVVVAR